MNVAMLVVDWPADAPRGAVTRFCRDHQVSRSWFYELRARLAVEGLDGLQPRCRAPVRSPLAVPVEVEEVAVRLRKQLAGDGCGCGPISVRDEMLKLGVCPPSVATLARIFTRRGMVVPQPQKRPRSADRRFEFPQVHDCWQLDSFDWPLLDGSAAVVFQLEDDHSRCLVGSRAAAGETSQDAIAVFDAGVAAYQVPGLLLTDNGTALNPSRRGKMGQLVSHLQQLGTKPITGRPGHPQTQGKDERVHQTCQSWLRVRPRAATLTELQAQLDIFDQYYNQHRGHQALGMDPVTGRLRTPAQVVAEDPVAVPPSPPTVTDDQSQPVNPLPRLRHRTAVVRTKGRVQVINKQIQVGAGHIGETVYVIIDEATVLIFDNSGQILRIVQTSPNILYYGNGKPRGRHRKPRSS
jgi:putative transposase